MQIGDLLITEYENPLFLIGKHLRRHFEFKDYYSNKFWEIELQDRFFITYFGRSGTEGLKHKKECKSIAEAEYEYNKIIQSKIKKGYKETGRIWIYSFDNPERTNSIIVLKENDIVRKLTYDCWTYLPKKMI